MTKRSRGPGEGDIREYEDVSEWQERRKAVRGDRRSSYELKLKMFRDWTAYVVGVTVLVASIGALIGWLKWDGPITPQHVLVAATSGWLGKRLR